MPRVIIDSRNRIKNDNDQENRSEYLYSLAKPFNKVKNMVLKHVQVPKHPTVVTGVNDIIYYQDTTNGNTTVTFAQGYYTPSELVDSANTLMSAANPGTETAFISSYDPISNKMSLIADENVKWAHWANSTELARRNGQLLGSYTSTSAALSSDSVNPFEMQLNSPKYYTLTVDTGFNGSYDTSSNNGQFSFVIPAHTSELYEVTVESENGSFLQDDSVSNGYFNELRVRWHYEDQLTPCPDWEGKDHVIIVEFEN